jgi:hypothetical protein
VPNHLAGLRNIDYTDRELLHVIESTTSNGDGALAQDVAVALGFEPDGRGRQSVSVRLSWMVRYGYLDRVDPKEQPDGKAGDPVRWVITPLGRELMVGKLSKSVESQIDRASAGSQLLIMRRLARRAFFESDEGIGTAVRREYQHSEAHRNR